MSEEILPLTMPVPNDTPDASLAHVALESHDPAMHQSHNGILASSDFWYSLAFIMFLVLLGRKIYALVAKAMDKRAESIRERIEEAQALREEAQALLSTYKKKQREAEEEIKELMADAERSAKQMREETMASINESLKSRQQQALQKIALAEREAIHEIQTMAADIALAAAQELIRERLSAQLSEEMNTQAIKQLNA